MTVTYLDGARHWISGLRREHTGSPGCVKPERGEQRKSEQMQAFPNLELAYIFKNLLKMSLKP